MIFSRAQASDVSTRAEADCPSVTSLCHCGTRSVGGEAPQCRCEEVFEQNERLRRGVGTMCAQRVRSASRVVSLCTSSLGAADEMSMTGRDGVGDQMTRVSADVTWVQYARGSPAAILEPGQGTHRLTSDSQVCLPGVHKVPRFRAYSLNSRTWRERWSL